MLRALLKITLFSVVFMAMNLSLLTGYRRKELLAWIDRLEKNRKTRQFLKSRQTPILCQILHLPPNGKTISVTSNGQTMRFRVTPTRPRRAGMGGND